MAPLFDEDRLKGSNLDPVELVTRLAREKALSIAATRPAAMIIGSDQMALFEHANCF